MPSPLPASDFYYTLGELRLIQWCEYRRYLQEKGGRMFIKPSRQQFDPALQLRTAGVFYCILSDIVEIDPDPRYDSKKPRLVFEFTVVDRKVPHLHGQKGATIVSASVFKHKQTGQESNLVKLGRMMGVVNPEKGFDPDVLLDKYYHVQFVLSEGRAYASNVMPAAAPTDRGQPELSHFDPTHGDPGSNDGGDVPF